MTDIQRPPMKVSQGHPDHNMPEPEHDGEEMGIDTSVNNTLRNMSARSAYGAAQRARRERGMNPSLSSDE